MKKSLRGYPQVLAKITSKITITNRAKRLASFILPGRFTVRSVGFNLVIL